MTGRPSTFTQDLADRICAELAEGRSLRSVCREDWAPSTQTVFRWLREHQAFRNQYARAKEEAADALADEIIDIADEREGKAIMSEGEEVAVVFDATAVARNRLRIDARKWVASKLKPKRYGDRVELAGPEGGPVQFQVLTAVPEPARDAD